VTAPTERGVADPPGAQAGTPTVGESLADVTRDISLLLRQEIELAEAELRRSAREAGVGAGLMGASAMAGLLALAFLSVAIWWALGDEVGGGWSAVIVAAAWLVIAAVTRAVGRSRAARVRGVPETADTVRRIPDALKGQEGRP